MKRLLGAAQSAAPNREEEVIKLRSTDLLLLLFNIRKNIKSKLFGFDDQPRRVSTGTNLGRCYFDRHGNYLALLYSNQRRKKEQAASRGETTQKSVQHLMLQNPTAG